MNDLQEPQPLEETAHHKVLKGFAQLAWYKCNSGRDFPFGINGGRGAGKSTLAVQFLREYNSLLGINLTRTVLKQQMCSDPELLDDRIHNLPIGWPVAVDEAALSAFKGDHAKRDVKDLFKLITICRTKHRPIIFVTPDIDDIISRIMKYWDYRVRVLDWGAGVIFARDRSEGSRKDPFHMTELKELEGYYDATTPIDEIIKRLKKHPCYKDFIEWRDLTVELREAYEEYRNEMVYGGGVLQRSKENDKIAMVLFNLRQHWEMLKQRKKLYIKEFNSVLCVNPIDKTMFWKTPTHLSESITKIERELEKRELIKPGLIQERAIEEETGEESFVDENTP